MTVGPLVAAWWDWMVSVSVLLVPVCAVALVVDLTLGRHLWPSVRTALWVGAGLRLLTPPTVLAPVGLAGVLSVADAPSLAPLAPSQQAAPFLACVAWLAVALVLLGRGLLEHRRTRRAWLADAHDDLPPDTLRAARRAARRLGLRRLPALRLSPSAQGPAVVGCLDPVVILPEALARGELDAAGQEHVLLHEFAHLKRRDPLAALVTGMLTALYWFHPLAWLTRRRLQALRELACDATVARALGPGTESYRRTLLRLARPLLGERPAAATAPLAFLTPGSPLVARLEWLRRPRQAPGRLRLCTGPAVLGLLALCCLPVERGPYARPSADQTELTLLLDSLDPTELEGCLPLRYAVFGLSARTKDPREAPP